MTGVHRVPDEPTTSRVLDREEELRPNGDDRRQRTAYGSRLARMAADRPASRPKKVPSPSWIPLVKQFWALKHEVARPAAKSPWTAAPVASNTSPVVALGMPPIGKVM